MYRDRDKVFPPRYRIPICIEPGCAERELDIAEKHEGRADVSDIVDKLCAILDEANLTPLQIQAMLVDVWTVIQTEWKVKKE